MQNAAKENAHFCQQLFIKHVTSRKLHTVLRAGLRCLLCAASRGSRPSCSPGASEEGKAHGLLPILVLFHVHFSGTTGCQRIWVWRARGDALPPARAWSGWGGECPSAASGSWLVVAVVSLQFPYFPFYGSQGWRAARPARSRCASAVLVLKAWHGCCNTLAA